MRPLVAALWLLPAIAAGAAGDPEPIGPLRVAVMPIVSAVDWTDTQPVGAMVDIWNEIAGRLGIRTEFVRVSSIDTLLELLTNARADVALGPLAITEDRERIVDLTHPIFHSGMRIAVRQRTETGLMSAVRSLLSWELLGLLATTVPLAILSGHLLWWLERRRNPHSFPRGYPRGVGEAIWWIVSTIVTGGCDDKHVDSLAGRLLAFAWMIGGIAALAAFTSTLTATMTAERVSGTIRSARDLAGRTVACQKSAVSVGSIRERGGVVEEYATIHDALDALQLGMVEAVVSESQSLMYAISRTGRPDIRLVGPIFDSFDFGIGLPNGSPIREQLNTAILQMREDGSLDRIMAQWLGTHD